MIRKALLIATSEKVPFYKACQDAPPQVFQLDFMPLIEDGRIRTRPVYEALQSGRYDTYFLLCHELSQFTNILDKSNLWELMVWCKVHGIRNIQIYCDLAKQDWITLFPYLEVVADLAVSVDLVSPPKSLEAFADKIYCDAYVPIHPSRHASPEVEVSKHHEMGIIGSIGVYAYRAQCVQALRDAGIEVYQAGGAETRYALTPEAYFQELAGCRMTLNTSSAVIPKLDGSEASAGSGAVCHVKGRVFEAMISRCLVFEDRGSPALDIFQDGEEIVSYGSPQELIEKVLEYRANPERLVAVTRQAYLKAREMTRPDTFWGGIVLALMKQMQKQSKTRSEAMC